MTASGEFDAIAEARRVIEAVNQREADFLMTKLATGYVAEWPDATLDRDASIVREIEMMSGLPDLRFDIDAATMLADGRVLVEATVVGTHSGDLVLPFGVTLAATGRSLEMPFDFIMTFADGLLAHERLRFDHQVLVHQLTDPPIADGPQSARAHQGSIGSVPSDLYVFDVDGRRR